MSSTAAGCPNVCSYTPSFPRSETPMALYVGTWINDRNLSAKFHSTEILAVASSYNMYGALALESFGKLRSLNMQHLSVPMHGKHLRTRLRFEHTGQISGIYCSLLFWWHWWHEITTAFQTMPKLTSSWTEKKGSLAFFTTPGSLPFVQKTGSERWEVPEATPTVHSLWTLWENCKAVAVAHKSPNPQPCHRKTVEK